MSAKSDISVSCPNCKTKFSTILFQSVWGEYERYREMIFNDKINLAKCPNCSNVFRVENSLFYNDTDIQFAIWWEPKPDPEIDVCDKGWNKLYGPNFYMVNAARVASWEEFKSSIRLAYELHPKIKEQSTANLDPLQHNSTNYPQKLRLTSSSNDVRFWKITSIIFFLSLIALTMVYLNSIKKAEYYPRGTYTLSDQERLADNYLRGEGKVINYERAYFWALVALASGSHQYEYERIRYIEKKISPAQIRTIQNTADRWFRKNKN